MKNKNKAPMWNDWVYVTYFMTKLEVARFEIKCTCRVFEHAF